MEHQDIPQFLGLSVIVFVAAKICRAVAQSLVQPAVRAESVSGVVIVNLALVDPTNEVLHLLAELGVVNLLFEIGLEMDLQTLLNVASDAQIHRKYLLWVSP